MVSSKGVVTMKTRVKIPANNILQFNDNNIDARPILDYLYDAEIFTKKKDNVIRSVSNALYNGDEVTDLKLDLLTGEVIIECEFKLKIA